ncbi:MAG: tRNA preQ1(34) S-adenosylmethionine ribosyltransferase-isomerase QueA [Actinobacteria bacterium]|nr:MAG: tRNA preQ1(34) S-adenosylmethionine ribosyltransferase-isomerase QueA [Actinomycetota bacterium]
MKTCLFDYKLPENLIAQKPVEPRDSSRLMVLDRQNNSVEHKRFSALIDYIKPGDLLVVNDTRVLPARLYGKKTDTGAKIELLLLKEVKNNLWEVLAKPAKRLKIGSQIEFEEGLSGIVEQVLEDGRRLIRFILNIGAYCNTPLTVKKIIEEIGEVPLPPYIKTPLDDSERYQTIYSKNANSKAAPTAGLHLTDTLMKSILKKGAFFTSVTLHVGLDTFRPVTAVEVEKHKIHSEGYAVPKLTLERIRQAKNTGNRIIAVGTTSVRVLETISCQIDSRKSLSGSTKLFIYPGYKFKLVDVLLTNFHLPRSSLLMLVSAFAGTQFVKEAYSQAIKEKYRFFSFGDAMLIK